MRKIFPIILAIIVSILGYLYFNQGFISASQIDSVDVYHYKDSEDKKASPLMKLDSKKLIKIFAETVNSSEITDAELSVTDPDFLIEVVEKGNKNVFTLWINEDTNRAMYKNKKSRKFYIITKSSTIKLKTLLFR